MKDIQRILGTLEAVTATPTPPPSRLELLSIPGVTKPCFSKTMVNFRRSKSKQSVEQQSNLEQSAALLKPFAALNVSKVSLVPNARQTAIGNSRSLVGQPRANVCRLKTHEKPIHKRSNTTLFTMQPVQGVLPSDQQSNHSFMKSRPVLRLSQTISPALKHELFVEFLNKMRESNGMEVTNSSIKGFKFYVGAGNNAQLIKRIIATRWWWTPCASMKEANFIWSSTLSHKAVSCLAEFSTVPLKSTKKPRSSHIIRFGFEKILASSEFLLLSEDPVESHEATLYNRLPHNHELCSKKNLLRNMQDYFNSCGLSAFSILPLTFHVTSATDPEFCEFEDVFRARTRAGENNLWIVKPGEDSNRGRGIKVCCSLKKIKTLIAGPSMHTFIIQKYIDSPFLICGRKFDLRCFGLLTCVNGTLQGYYYQEGYVRTAAVEYSVNSRSKYVHLTNDAVQQQGKHYGKHERANKLTFAELQLHLGPYDVEFDQDIQPQIRRAVTDSFKAAAQKLDPQRRQHCFELFGYDFMIDSAFKVWLLEVNTNASLCECEGVLSRYFSGLIQNTMQIVLDPLFPPPKSFSRKLPAWSKEFLVANKFELVYAERAMN